MTIRTLCARIKGQPDVTEGTAYAILFTISFAHLLNDMIQSVIPAIYPMIKDKFGFSFAQIGVITLVFQLTSSILQPFVGALCRPSSPSLCTLVGHVFHVGRIVVAFFCL